MIDFLAFVFAVISALVLALPLFYIVGYSLVSGALMAFKTFTEKHFTEKQNKE